MISQTLAGRDALILDAKSFDGPDALADMLGFLGVESYASSAVASYAAREPAWPERLDDVTR